MAADIELGRGGGAGSSAQTMDDSRGMRNMQFTCSGGDHFRWLGGIGSEGGLILKRGGNWTGEAGVT